VNEQQLGRLEQVSLRTIWADEAGDFTPWLAKPENLKLLGDTLGVELEPDSEEVAVGSFWADIVCRDTATGDKIVIENQIERTDHSHLGQILTYTAGVSAKTVVWIAARFTEEHRAALDWLNENTQEDISFFGLEVELWRIGVSPAAPKFNMVSKPNDWSKAVRQSTRASGEQSEFKKLQLEFWTAFKPFLEQRTGLQMRRPSPRVSAAISIGKRGFYLSAVASSWNIEKNLTDAPEIRVQLIMDSAIAKQQFAAIEKRKDEIEAQIGSSLIFHDPPGVSRCKIYIRRDCDFRNRENWNEAFEWLAKYLDLFSKTFRPIVKLL
jgi:hypothetical protein